MIATPISNDLLLQRLESFEGIIIVTTNAGDRIDSAFQRRMDVSINFTPPEAGERWAIWQLHLPAMHRIEPHLLDEAARRCELTGGQIRNAVLHASSLALEDRRAAQVRQFRDGGPARISQGGRASAPCKRARPQQQQSTRPTPLVRKEMMNYE